MTEKLGDWLIGIICVAMALALAEGLAPKGRMKRICCLAGGLALTISVLSPMIGIRSEDISGLIQEYAADTGQRTEVLEANNQLLFETVIQERVASYIWDKASEMGLVCEVTAETRMNDGLPYPYSVTIRGDIGDEEMVRLGSIIEEELDIPTERQYFVRGRS